MSHGPGKADGRHRILTDHARPFIEARADSTTFRGILDGTLDPRVMRRWIEQDHLYLHTYARVLARLASQAPDRHVATLVDGAYYTIHTEVPRIAELAELFGADLRDVEMGAACRGYTSHLLDHADRLETGVLAVLPCMIGFAAIGLTVEPPAEPRYRRWIEMYAAGDFQEYTARFADVVDDVGLDGDAALAVFEAGLRFEMALWDEAADGLVPP
jgi:thiaminase/transcriptional activator TenA